MRPCPDRLIREEVLRTSAYHVPDSTGFVKLDAMENPYLLPQDPARRHCAARCRMPRSTVIPMPARASSRPVCAGDEAAARYGHPARQRFRRDHSILALALARTRRGAAGRRAVLRHVQDDRHLRRHEICRRTAGADFSLDLRRDAGGHQSANNRRWCFWPIPTIPPATCSTREAYQAIIQARPGLVVVDEAYYAFASDSFIPHLARLSATCWSCALFPSSAWRVAPGFSGGFGGLVEPAGKAALTV